MRFRRCGLRLVELDQPEAHDIGQRVLTTVPHGELPDDLLDHFVHLPVDAHGRQDAGALLWAASWGERHSEACSILRLQKHKP